MPKNSDFINPQMSEESSKCTRSLKNHHVNIHTKMIKYENYIMK